MPDPAIPHLTLQGFSLGPNEKPLDLSWLLYKGAASTFKRSVLTAIESGKLGRPQLKRLVLLTEIHRNWQAGISDKTLSEASIRVRWRVLTFLVRFAEKSGTPFDIENISNLYRAYSECTKRRSDLQAQTKYAYSHVLAKIIAPVLDMDATKLQWKTKIRVPKHHGNQAAKENLNASTTFVQTLLHTIAQLSVEVIRGPLPVVLKYPSGSEYMVHCGCKHKPTDCLKGDVYSLKKAFARRERRANNITNGARSSLINLRLEAELLIFISQTSGNLTQVLQLNANQFRFQSDGEYYRLHAWKNRAKHSVELRIEKAYRPHFEAFLEWRNTIFPGDQDGLTFPFVWDDGDRATQRTCWGFQGTRKLMKAIGQPFVHSQQLRKTAGNFIKRKASRQTAAELLSNTEKTFRKNYEEAHHQSATRELVRFWADLEDSIMLLAVGPGACQQPEPQRREDAPAGSPKPDCEGSAGCLFCDKNRDLRSFDHVWNLASLHHLKLVEFNADRTPASRKKGHPVALTIERVAAKLDALSALAGECAEWVEEARTRVHEGSYHPFYTSAFNILEGNQ